MKKNLLKLTMFLVAAMIGGFANAQIATLPYTADFESSIAPFDAGDIVDATGWGKALRVNNTTATATFGESVSALTENDEVTIQFNALHGWEGTGYTTKVALLNTDDEELISYTYNIKDCKVTDVSIGGTTVSGFSAFMGQANFNNQKSVNGFTHSQHYVTTEGYTPVVKFIVSGAGLATFSFVYTSANSTAINKEYSATLGEKKADLGKIVITDTQTNTDRCFGMDNLSITKVTKVTYPYTVNFVDTNDQTVKSTEGRAEENTKISIDKESFWVNGKKYKYISDDSETKLISAEGTNVITVNVSESDRYTYSVKDNIGNTLVEGEEYEGEDITFYVPYFAFKEGKFYKSPSLSAGTLSYGQSTISAIAANTEITVTYTEEENSTVVFYSEAENLAGITTIDDQYTKIRMSNGKTGYFADKTAFTTLPAGKYTITSSTRSGATSFFAGENNVLDLSSTGAVANNTSEEFVLTKETEIFASAGSASAYFDYVIIRKTGDYVPSWIAPTIAGEDPVSGSNYKVMNVGSGKFLAMGKAWFSWSTTAIVADDGFTATFTGDAASFTLTNTNNSKFVFTSGNEIQGDAMHADGGTATNYGLTQLPNGNYRIHDAGGNAESKCWGYNSDFHATGIVAHADATAEGWNCEWIFVGDNAANLFAAKNALYNALLYAEENGVETSEASAVYTNSDATIDELKAAAEKLNHATNLAVNTKAVEGATAENPIETNFVVNGTFDTAGVIAPWKTTGGFQNQTTATNQSGAFTVPFFENWNGNAKPNKMYQEIEDIPNGNYTLKICAFVNNFDAASQYVFANADQTPLTAGEPTAYEVKTIVTNNKIEIGLEQTAAVANWMGIDNVSLVYNGETNIEELVGAYEEALLAAQAVEGKMNKDVKTTLDNAIAAEVDKTNAKALSEATATLAEATSAAKASVSAYVEANKAIENANAILNGTNVATAEAKTTFEEAIAAIAMPYEEGTLTTDAANAAGKTLGTIVTGWREGANGAAVKFMENAYGLNGFDGDLYINTWSVEGDQDGSNFSVPFYEYFVADGSLEAKTFTTTVSGLEAGTYDVTAWVRVQLKNGETAPAGVTIDANGGEAVEAIGTEATSQKMYLKETTATGVVGDDGILNININVVEGNNIHWLSFKNVKFEKQEEAADVETGNETSETATGGGSSNAQVNGESYFIAGTYIAGAGSAKTGNMASKGFKLRTGTDGSRAVFTVNEPYTITSLVLEGASNYAKKDGAETNTKVVKVEVDGVEVPFTGGNDFQYRGENGATSCNLTIANIKAKESIAIYFDNSGSTGSQLNVSYAITWQRPMATKPAIELTKKTLALVPGSTFKLEGKVDPAKYAEETTWVSDNESVATVAADGTVTAVAEGSANISLLWKQGEETVADTAVVTVNKFNSADFASVKTLDLASLDNVTLTIQSEAAGNIWNEGNNKPNPVYFVTNEGLTDIAVQAVESGNKGWSIVANEGLKLASGAGRCAAIGNLKKDEVVEIIYTGNHFYTGSREDAVRKDDGALKTALNEAIGHAIYQMNEDGMLGFELDKGSSISKICIYSTVDTGINTLKAEIENGAVYNLNGQKVQKAQKGLYIIGGKKVVVK